MVGTVLLLGALWFTLPDSTALRDSEAVFCDRHGARLTDLWDARLYTYSLLGGGYRLHHKHGAQGKEGFPDSFQIDPGPGLWAYVTASSDSGRKEACSSNEVFMPGTITGVPEWVADPVIRRELYDIHGRKTQGRASGIYFERKTHRSGRTERRMLLILK